MSWFDKIIPPKIKAVATRDKSGVPEGLWIKCKKCEAVLYGTDLTINLHVCPKCNASIEKSGGCHQMTCAVCKHKWCWVCGFADDYNDDSFRFHKIMVVTCSIISELTHMKWYWGTLLGLFLIVISPLIMLISFIVILNHCIVGKYQRTMKNYLYICNR